MPSKLSIIFYVAGLLICGTLNTITMKIAFSMPSESAEGDPEHFEKPWFITFLMFVSMALTLVFDPSLCRRPAGPGTAPLMQPSPTVRTGAAGLSRNRKIALIAVPAAFDVLATGLCSMGFLFIPCSVWQLLRGAEIIFASFFSVTCLRRPLWTFQLIALLCCVSGIVLVGLASLWGEPPEGSSPTSGGRASSPALVLLGMALALAGQVVQAAQVVAEEWLLKEVDLPGLQIVGFEGIWGGLLTGLLVFPAAYFVPGADHGRMEDAKDTFDQLSLNQPLQVVLAVYCISCATYNLTGMQVVSSLSAVHRVMLEASRTVIVWAFGLIVHASDPTSPYGEVWTAYSYLEVLGFLVLLLGQAIYGEMLVLPGLRYPVAQHDHEHLMTSPGALRNLAGLVEQ